MNTILRILFHALNQFSSHNAFQMGAALAYYTLFSLAPLLLVAVLIAGMIFGAEAARGELYEQLVGTAGQDNARLIQELIVAADESQAEAQWAPYLGLVISLAIALQAFLHLRLSFRVIWGIEPPKGNSFLGILLDYGLSVLMVLIVGLLLVVSLAASTVLRVIEDRWPLPIPGGWTLVEVVVSFIFLALAFGTMYWVLSGRTLPLGYVVFGGIICAVLFNIGKALLSWYLAFTAATSVYGAAGSLVGFLIWVYYSSLIIFLTAELIQAHRTRFEWEK